MSNLIENSQKCHIYIRIIVHFIDSFVRTETKKKGFIHFILTSFIHSIYLFICPKGPEIYFKGNRRANWYDEDQACFVFVSGKFETFCQNERSGW